MAAGEHVLSQNTGEAPVLVYDKNEVVKSSLEHDGTVVNLWLAPLDGRLNVQITKHIQGKSPTLVRLDGFYLVAEFLVNLGFSEEIMPYAYAEYGSVEGYMKPFETNVQAIITHSKWPLTIADQMAEAAQDMVGHFTGQTVVVGQMGQIAMTDHGEVDKTVEVGDSWTEKFELADDCVFCSEMTDEAVKDRVAGFQWAMDKEVANRFGAGMQAESVAADGHTLPVHDSHDDTDAGRREYHDQLKPWYTEHPMLLKVIPLIDLPLHLKRVLCIQWNHIVLEHLKVEPRFVHRKEDGMYFWMDVIAGSDDVLKRILPSIKTRSNPRGSTEASTNTYEYMGVHFGLF